MRPIFKRSFSMLLFSYSLFRLYSLLVYHLRSSFLLPTFLCCNEEGLFLCNSLSFARISKGGNQSNTIFLSFKRRFDPTFSENDLNSDKSMSEFAIFPA